MLWERTGSGRQLFQLSLCGEPLRLELLQFLQHVGLVHEQVLEGLLRRIRVVAGVGKPDFEGRLLRVRFGQLLFQPLDARFERLAR